MVRVMRSLAEAAIYRAARRLLAVHGERAIPVCESRARELLRAGDGGAFCLWFKIRAKVEDLLMTRRGRDHTIH